MKPVKIILFFLALLAGLCKSYAQSCSGALGDPIVNINFDNGLENGASTNYQYTSGTPADGFYTIAVNTNTMYGSWWKVGDHTGNPGGKMMVVNASVSKTDYFYKQTISGLCPGTTYEFAAWMLNLVKSGEILPNVTFNISAPDGTILGTYSTGNIPNSPDGKFTQYAMYFKTPAGGGNVILSMTNNANGGTGNDIALDDITFRACGPLVQSSFSSTGTVTTLNACAGTNQSYTLSASLSTGYINPVYQWQVNTGSGWNNITGATATTRTVNFAPAIAGTYQYRLQVSEAANAGQVQCSVYSNTIALIINVPPPAGTATATSPACVGGSVTLSASGGQTYAWTGPNGFTSGAQSPVINNLTMANAGTYHVVVTSLGCNTASDVTLTVNPKVTATAGSNVTVCKGTPTTLQATGGTSYHWSPAAGLSNPDIANPIASPTQTTTYTVTVSNSSGCSDQASVVVTIAEPPVADAGPDRKMSQGQSIVLNAQVSHAASWYWTPTDFLDDPTKLHPTATPPADITYTLHALPEANCLDEVTDQVFIRVYKKVTIPNTFTPNGDGLNDTWNIEALETYPESLTQVFNRNGTVVYSTHGYPKPWDGSYNGVILPTGTYYYKIDLKNGTVFSGWVVMVR